MKVKQSPSLKRHRFVGELLAEKWLTSTVKELTFSCPEEFEFNAGQYLNVFLEKSGKPVARSYSISSAPQRKGKLTLTLKRVENGLVTPFLLEKKVGMEVKMMGPFGNFVMGEILPEQGLVFIGTGTGLAPLKSMIENILARGFTYPVTLCTGVRYVRERLYQDLWKRMEERHKNFSYYSVVSRCEDAHYMGREGRVQSILAELTGFEKKKFYICGLQAMVNSVEQTLNDRGVLKEAIFYEKYDE